MMMMRRRKVQKRSSSLEREERMLEKVWLKGMLEAGMMKEEEKEEGCPGRAGEKQGREEEGSWARVGG